MQQVSLVLVLAGALLGCSSPTPPVAVSDGTIDAVPDSAPCGVRNGMRGKTRRIANAGGLQRSYIVYIPDGDPLVPMPLVTVVHGFTMSGQKMFDITEYVALADREKVALAFPDGQNGPDATSGAPWNVGADVCPSYLGEPPNASGDDFAFLDAMKADVATDQCLDLEHVYVTGFSMGGYFSHEVGCNRSDVRAVAPHSGGTHDLAGCTAGPKPIIMFHGSSDPLIPNGCTDPAAAPIDGVVPAATAWARHNGCGTTTTTTTITNGTCFAYAGCPVGGQVTYCTLTSMGHCWAGGPSSGGAYACPAFAAATELTWDFFKQHAW